jgi:hypothetical protein
MMKSEEERAYYRILSRIRKLIETRFSQFEDWRCNLRFYVYNSRLSFEDASDKFCT